MPAPNTATIAALLRQGLAANQRPLITITSNSMAPLLRQGDQIVVAPITWRALQPGDIVVVEAPGTLLTHRFYGTLFHGSGRSLLLRGDRPLGYDRPMPAEDLIGRVVARTRQRTISLEAGRGLRVSSHLSSLARLESRIFLGHNPARPESPSLTVPQLGPGAKLFRRLIYYWASLVAATLRLAPDSTRPIRRPGKES